MRAFPAPRLLWGVGALCVLAFGLFVHDAFGYVVAVLFGVLMVGGAYDAWWLRKHRGALSAELDAPQTLTRGERAELGVTVHNDTARDRTLWVRPVLPDETIPNYVTHRTHAVAGDAARFRIPLGVPLRGRYTFGPVYVRLDGPLGLIRGQVCCEARETTRVYPDVRRVQDYLVTRKMQDTVAPHLRTARIRGIGSEFESMREYELGDDIRRIDWKATAKHRMPIVRNYEIEPFRNVMVIVDAGRLMAGSTGDATKLDCALDAALMVAGVVLEGGDRCGTLVFDEDVRAYLPPRGGLAQLRAIVENTYALQPTYVESHFQRAFAHLQTRLTKRSLVLILSDVIDPYASASLLSGVVALSRRHLVMFAALRTPEVERVIDTPSASPEDPYRKAVAYRLFDERTMAITRLQRSGVHVLDVKPQDLTVPLVNKYIELREANML